MPLYNGQCKECGNVQEDVFSRKYLEDGELLSEKCSKCGSESLIKNFTGTIGAGSFGLKPWTYGLSSEQQATKAYESAFGRE